MNEKSTSDVLLQQIDNLTALKNQLQGMSDCLDALSDRYKPGDDIGFMSDSAGRISTALGEIADTLERLL